MQYINSMSKTTTLNEHVVRDTRALFDANYKHRIGEVEGGCLLWAAATVAACQKNGISASLQAGTTMFRIVHPNDDDGICDDYFSYKFVQSEAISHMMMGNFPEMHAWAYVPECRTILDLTYPYQPSQCKKLTGLYWDERLLPDGPLCRTVDELDADEMSRVIYQADSLAISMAIALLKQFHEI